MENRTKWKAGNGSVKIIQDKGSRWSVFVRWNGRREDELWLGGIMELLRSSKTEESGELQGVRRGSWREQGTPFGEFLRKRTR